MSWASSRILVQRLIYSKKGTLKKKKKKKSTKNFITPYLLPFLSVLYQNKALHNFQKRGSIQLLDT